MYICGYKTTFAGEQWRATGSHMTGSDVIYYWGIEKEEYRSMETLPSEVF
jgi:hypothetical protein